MHITGDTPRHFGYAREVAEKEVKGRLRLDFPRGLEHVIECLHDSSTDCNGSPYITIHGHPQFDELDHQEDCVC